STQAAWLARMRPAKVDAIVQFCAGPARRSGRHLRQRRCRMRAIVVTDQAAGTAGMALTERPEPTAAINDVIVQFLASGLVSTETEWPSTWTDRRGGDRTPSVPGHEL